MNFLNFRPSYRRNLPHRQPPDTTLFVTCRLAGSIPAEVQRALAEQARSLDSALASIPDESLRRDAAEVVHKSLFARWDRALDEAAHGPRWLRDERIAKIIVTALHFQARERCLLDAYCIMPNHIHLLITPRAQEDGSPVSITRIMHSFKRYSGREANRLLNRTGPFWQSESYDHYVRDDAERERIVWYIVNNPVKAGLVSEWQTWPWSHVAPPLDSSEWSH